MYIFKVVEISDEIVVAFQNLIPQLTASHPPPARGELTALVKSGLSTLLVCRHPDERGPIIGALTLIVFRVPTGVRAHIEDVIVDEATRGQGIGEALVQSALKVAREAGANGVALTSNPRRETANRLYRRVGFKSWATNLYFYEF